ncbi:MAG: M15 family peptidase [Actinophytocola sp.]|nr:M15 family peptidase [Actinophytocola sp.]
MSRVWAIVSRRSFTRYQSRFRAPRTVVGRLALLSAGALLIAGCGPHGEAQVTSQSDTGAVHVASASTPDPSWAEPAPGPLRKSILTPDFLIVGEKTLSRSARSKVREIDGVRAAMPISVASVAVGERSITVGGVDAADYRRFTATQTAKMDEVWQSVAGGEAAITHQIGRDLRRPLGGSIDLRTANEQHKLRIGAYATTVPRIDAVVNERRAQQLGMKRHNAIVVSAGKSGVDSVEKELEQLLGKRGDVQRLAENPPSTGERHAAYLTGGAVAQAVGSFKYKYFADGTVEPASQWVHANIRTETVPLLGRVTCHRVMLPQLRNALTEIVDRELADRIDSGDYGGCYVPRFIGRDPQRGLSLHTWGIAVDLNVAGNQRGTEGEIDREVVAIFKKWGFAWGGDWDYTDPMHFELAALVS